MQPVFKQWIGISFFIRSVQIDYKEENWGKQLRLRAEGSQFKIDIVHSPS
jgi:hypothetical protein